MPVKSDPTSIQLLGALVAGAFVAVHAFGSAAEDDAGKASAFSVASVHFEQNATDGDVEVVYRAKGDDDGLADLRIVAPDGRTVVQFSAPDASTLGMRQFLFESPEPSDLSSLKAAYPEGVYKFFGTTFSGEKLFGESMLTHELPPTVGFLEPAEDADSVRTTGLAISWSPVSGAAYYVVELEQDDRGTKIEATLPASLTTLDIPDSFLTPGTEYQLGIGAVSPDGNISFVETSFTTAR